LTLMDLKSTPNLAKENGKNGAKPSLAVVAVRARDFLEMLRAGAVERGRREALYVKMVEVVFAYWAAKLHHPAALLDRKRERRLMARLRESAGDWGQLCYAVDGAMRDDWLMGRAVNSPRKYDGIETIFRDREQVERLAELCPPFVAGQPHPLVTKYNYNGGAE
jgi:hypothetical protein